MFYHARARRTIGSVMAWGEVTANIMASCLQRRSVDVVYVSSVIRNIKDHLSKRCPHVKFIDVPVGCSQG